MRWLDTNIILRYLTRDDPVKAAACFALFQRLRAGDEEVTTSEAVITEVVYVLAARAHYHLSPADIRSRLSPILRLPGLKLPGKRVYLRALDLYDTYPALDFEDTLTVARMHHDGVTELYSYDTDFDGISGLVRVEPETRGS